MLLSLLCNKAQLDIHFAYATSRCPTVLVMRSVYMPDACLAEESSEFGLTLLSRIVDLALCIRFIL